MPTDTVLQDRHLHFVFSFICSNVNIAPQLTLVQIHQKCATKVPCCSQQQSQLSSRPQWALRHHRTSSPAQARLSRLPLPKLASVSRGLSFHYRVGGLRPSSGRLADQFTVTTSPPTVMLTAPSSSSELLLIMVDLDTPYGPGNNPLAPFLHWLQPSIPSSGLSVDVSNATQAPSAPYLHPQPPPISPPHRFVILSIRTV